MLKSIEVKLYPTDAQVATLNEWLGVCCWLYNRMLEHRTKAYKRRGESATCYDQFKMLTGPSEQAIAEVDGG